MWTVAVVNDLVFESRLRATAEALGVRLRCVRTAADAERALESPDVARLIVDLHWEHGDALEVLRRFRRRRSDGVAIGFFSHVQTETKRAAQAAGFDHVLPRSVFVEQLPQLLRPAAGVFDDAAQLPAGFFDGLSPQPLPARVLMCPPEHFDVIDEKNPHMAGQQGRVDRALAGGQWEALRRTFAGCGVSVETIAPTPGCEDMVFCANQTLAGLDAAGRRVCLLSRMRHASRQREVPAFGDWFASQGYRVEPPQETRLHEGSGDALWHPGRGLIWGGHGHRTDAEAYEGIAALFGAPVIRLRLLSERFYHLDTALCLIDERTALVNPAALESRGLALLRAGFPRLIEVPPDEADQGFACNATALLGRHVIVQRGCPVTAAALRELGYEVHEVETGEFLRSGGSVFCLKMYVF
jgi:N-dimethylarginine dimethylaminohydrolase